MSKSLKNFITIRQALEGVDGMEPVRPSTMRLMFCLVSYTAPCDYSDNMLGNARIVEKKFREHFLNVATVLRKADNKMTVQHKNRPRDAALLSALAATQTRVRARFLDNFDTPGVILALQGLVDAAGSYLDTHDRDSALGAPRTLPICAAARYIADILLKLGIVGLVTDDVLSQLRTFPVRASAGVGLTVGVASSTAALAPLLDVIAEFRDNIRGAGRTQNTSKVLSLCDELRDNTLLELGVRLEDKGTTSVWKLEDPAVLRAERILKARDASAKEQARTLEAAKRATKAATANVHPRELFKKRDAKYTHFDNDGIPTHDLMGQPLPKSQIKKLKKEWDKQKKIYDKTRLS
jgi:cysteinyl-tRNA synthetase